MHFHWLAALANGAKRNIGVADHRAGFDLFDHRPAGRARHEEEQAGVGESNGGFGHQLGRGLVFAVSVRNVQAHAAGSGGADLNVQPRADFAHGAIDQQDVADQLRHGLRDEQSFKRPLGLFPVVLGRRRVADADVSQQSVNLALGNHRAGVNILIADGGSGVDRIHDHVRPVFENQLRQTGSSEGGVEVAEEIGVKVVAPLVAFQQSAAFFFGEVGAQKHVAPHADKFDPAVWEQAPKPGRAVNGVVDFLLEKRSDDDAART